MKAMRAADARREALRLTAWEFCRLAGLHHVMYSRGLTTGQIGIQSVGRIEKALDAIEAERAGV